MKINIKQEWLDEKFSFEIFQVSQSNISVISIKYKELRYYLDVISDWSMKFINQRIEEAIRIIKKETPRDMLPHWLKRHRTQEQYNQEIKNLKIEQRLEIDKLKQKLFDKLDVFINDILTDK